MILAPLAAVGVAWMAGAGVVATCWNRGAALPALAWLSLAGLVGPCAVGGALLVAGILGLPVRLSLPLVTLVSAGLFAVGARRRWRVLPAAPRAPALVVLVLVAAVGWTSWVASRTHLGWDGTVVWYHKARILAASGGAMPSATLADQTRSWSAPDYPLQVPLAMAWVRLWQPREDERTIKVLPAAWYAAILMLVAAAVLERTGSAARASLAAVVVATTPALVIGEGNFTSGYGDGPLAGLLAALVWAVWRSDHGAHREWQALLTVVAIAVAWTKQEGLMAVLVAGAVCAWRGGGALSRLTFAWPAIALAGAWQSWASMQGAPTGMAYEWPGAHAAVGRIGPIVAAYATTLADTRMWGWLWPGLAAALLANRRAHRATPLPIVGVTAVVAAVAFVWSDWPDVRAHLLVTVPRLMAHWVPSTVILTLGATSAISGVFSQPSE